MSAHSCFPCYWKHPPSLDWILKFNHGHLSENHDDIIERQIVQQLVHTRHVAIICVLGERESGKTLILDALIRQLVGKDVPTFARPFGLPIDRSDDLIIVTSALLMPQSTREPVGVLFVDVRSRTLSSPCYLQLMKIAYKFATVKLLSHYKSLSPELSQMAAEDDIIHVESPSVSFDGIKIRLSDDLFGKVCKAIQDAGYSEHAMYFRLNERFRQSYVEFERHQDEQIKSKPRNQNTPQYLPEPRLSSSSFITNNNVPKPSAYFGPHVDAKPPQYPQLHKEPKATQSSPSQLQQEDHKGASQTSTGVQHSQSVPIYEDEADEQNQEELESPEQLTPPSYQGCHSTQAQVNKELTTPQSDTGHCQSYSVHRKQGNALNAKATCGIAKVLPTVVSSVKLEMKLQGPSPYQTPINNRCLLSPGCAKVAECIPSQIVPENAEIQSPALHSPMPLVQTRRKASEDNSQLFKSEYECAQQAVQHAVATFKNILPSNLPALVTTKDQNKLLSSYAAIIIEAFKLTNYEPAWEQAAHEELKPRLHECMKEIFQANKNTIRRWDKALDSALRQCGQVYHAEMQKIMQSKTKVSTAELENHHLNARGPTLKAFSVPTEVNVPTRARWEAILEAKLEEWKGGFVYLNDSSPEPAKVTASSQKRGQTGVGIYLGKYAILFAVVIQDGGRSIVYQRQLSPFISFSEQGVHITEDNSDFNIYEILTKPTVPRGPKTLQLGHDLHSVTQEMAAILYFHGAKQLLDDLCGMDNSFACVTIHEHISAAAKTSIKQSLLMGGFAHVKLIPFAIAIAFNLLQNQPVTVGKIFSIHHSAAVLEISRIAIDHNSGLTVEKTSWTDNMTPKILFNGFCSMIEKDSAAQPTAVIVQEEEGCSKEISRFVRSFNFGVPPKDFHNCQPWDTTIAIAKYAEVRRQMLPVFPIRHNYYYNIWITGCTGRLMFLCKEAQCGSIRIEQSEGKTNEDLYIEEGIDKGSNENVLLWSYPFRVSTPVASGPVCGFNFEPDGSLGIEKLEGVNARVCSKTSKFLSQWDREVLAEDVKRYLAALAQPVSTGAMSNEKYTEQDDSVRGQLVGLIKRVRDSLKNPSFVSGPVRDLLVERVELYSDVLANECASEKDLHKAFLKLQAVTEGIL